MSLPASSHARLFYRIAIRRLDDASILRKANHETGAVYLAGYAVECMLKALVLNSLPLDKQEAMLQTFRGNRAHDFQWLRQQYLENRGVPFPREITR